jgi:exoribonuclease R
MRAIADPTNALDRGLAAIRRQYQVPEAFPAEILAAAGQAVQRIPTEHIDRTGERFVTLDPASSTDLDQAFAIERSGADLLLHYAIADVAWFVTDGDLVDTEAWRRGTTLYMPDGKAGLYPPVLSEGAASLLPGGPRPAVVFTVRVNSDGAVRLDGAERAIVRNAAKLAYDSVRLAELPPDFDELAQRIEAAEARRGGARVDPPEQEVVALGGGRYELAFRPMTQAEQSNAALSLAANLAIADALLAHRTGLFRVMDEPDQRAIKRLRLTAKALDLDWPQHMSLETYELTLDHDDPKQAAFMLAIRRAGPPAGYMPYVEGVRPWHSAMAASYAHATAPLRRLADRYVVQAAWAVANGRAVPHAVTEAFAKLPTVMARADVRSGQIQRAAVDLAETVMLHGREDEIFSSVVTDVDQRGARIQLCALPVAARVDAEGVQAGEVLPVRLVSADPERRELRFSQAPN